MESWTKEQVNTAFKNLLIDSGLFSGRERDNIIRLAFTNQELAFTLGKRINALKRENAALRKELEKGRQEEPTLFKLTPYITAPPDWASRYRREILRRETVPQQRE